MSSQRAWEVSLFTRSDQRGYLSFLASFFELLDERCLLVVEPAVTVGFAPILSRNSISGRIMAISSRTM